MNIDIPFIMLGIIGFAIIMYVVLDGFDLGIGILFPWVESHEQRDTMMNSIAPLWDGNETWLVLGGALLYGAFPEAFSTLLPLLYIPIILMLCALIFRGVAFEFRFKAHRSRWLWDVAFAGGSTVAAFCQGLILGTFVHGYANPVVATASSYSWFTPFSIMAGLGVIFGYALLGATWLIMKTDGALQQRMLHNAKILVVGISVFMVIVSLWTPFIDPHIMRRWFDLPNFYYLLPLPLLTGLAILALFYSLYTSQERAPFLLSIFIFLCGYTGLSISVWPYIVPRTLTFWQAASNESALIFTLVGVLILLPVLVGYSIYAYWVFRGKVKHEQGYH